jgi:hypothetical protein
MDNNKIYLCPHCGNKTNISIEKLITTTDETLTSPDGEIIPIECTYTLGICSTCQDVLLFGSYDDNELIEDLNSHQLLYPYQKILPQCVPEQLRQSYAEAKKVIKISPIAFTVLIRRSMEFVCLDQKAKGRSLNEKLSYLVKNEVIPKTLADMTTVLRLLGNIGAHATTILIDLQDVQIIDDFFNAIIEYVYIAPYKLLSYQDKLKKYSAIKKQI